VGQPANLRSLILTTASNRPNDVVPLASDDGTLLTHFINPEFLQNFAMDDLLPSPPENSSIDPNASRFEYPLGDDGLYQSKKPPLLHAASQNTFSPDMLRSELQYPTGSSASAPKQLSSTIKSNLSPQIFSDSYEDGSNSSASSGSRASSNDDSTKSGSPGSRALDSGVFSIPGVPSERLHTFSVEDAGLAPPVRHRYKKRPSEESANKTIKLRKEGTCVPCHYLHKPVRIFSICRFAHLPT
jgi:hypothetical protein